MLQLQVILLMVLSGYTLAVPLNINLGAYSPAFVVGDGEISLGGKESATQIMGALQGAAVTAAGANAAGAATGAAAAAPATAGEPNTEQASAIAALAPPGSTISVPSSSGQDAPPQAPSLATGAGLGNDIEPRIRPRVSADSELDEEDAEAHVVQGSKEANIGALAAKRSERVHARDLSGFDRALNFAATALTTTPKIALGTGEGGSGVGIIQEAGINNGGPKTAAAAATTTTTTTAAPAKREVVEEAPEKRAKVTTVYIRQLPESSELEQADGAVEKRGVEDSISVDVSKARTLAMTFVEEE